MSKKYVIAARSTDGSGVSGLTPTWVGLYDPVAGTSISPQPTITELGSGLYTFPVQDGIDLCGVVDLGSSASVGRYPRFVLGSGERKSVVWLSDRRKTSVATAPTPDWRPVAVRSNIINSGTTSLSSAIGNTYRNGYPIPVTCYDLKLRYGNYYAGGWGETPNTNSIGIQASIEFPVKPVSGTPTVYDVFFSGRRYITLEGGAIIESDPVGININADVTGTVTAGSPTATVFNTTLTCFDANTWSGQILYFTSGALAGQWGYISTNLADGSGQLTFVSASVFQAYGTNLTLSTGFSAAPSVGDAFKIIPVVYVRTYVGDPTVSAGSAGTVSIIPLGDRGYGGGTGPPFDAVASGALATESGSLSTNLSSTYSPTALLGICQKPTTAQPAVYIGGDSIVHGIGSADVNRGKGSGDNTGNTSWVRKALQRNFIPYVMGPKSGELSTDFQNIGTANRRKCRMVMMRGCKYAILDYGTNDLATRTAAAVESSILEITAALNAQNIKVFWATMVPKSTTTDSWSTTANQTLTGANETKRTTINSWLRDTSASGYVAQAGGGSKAAFLDPASKVEVNAAGTLTLNGGYWKTGTQYATGTSTGTGSSSLTDSGASFPDYTGKLVSSLASGNFTMAEIQSNTGTVLTVGTWSNSTPTSGQAYYIYSSYTMDGTHPTEAGHRLMMPAINTALFR